MHYTQKTQELDHAFIKMNIPTTTMKTNIRFTYKQKSRGSSCDPALSVHDNVNHHQDNTRDQHVNTSLDHS